MTRAVGFPENVQLGIRDLEDELIASRRLLCAEECPARELVGRYRRSEQAELCPRRSAGGHEIAVGDLGQGRRAGHLYLGDLRPDPVVGVEILMEARFL